MAYGTTSNVAALTPRYANSTGVFDANTRPAITMVVTLLDQVSAAVDSMMAAEGFSTPVTNTTVVKMLDMFVEQEVASIVEGINGSGRFGPTAKAGGGSRFTLIFQDIQSFIKANAAGMERAGAARTGLGGQIAYRGSDNSGNAVAPIFQREAFGNTFDDWDSD